MEPQQRKRTVLDWTILCVVVAIAVVVILLSFTNTAKLAVELGLNEYLTAGLVEILFASLLFIRGRQRATQKNVPLFLSVAYFASLFFVTGVNVWGLAAENPTVGPVVGVAVSLAMWTMEQTLVWLWTESHQPHRKSLWELKREALVKQKAAELRQIIDWMDWQSQQPSLKLIKQARKEEKKREKIIAQGMPRYFTQAQQGVAPSAQAPKQLEAGTTQAESPKQLQATESPNAGVSQTTQPPKQTDTQTSQPPKKVITQSPKVGVVESPKQTKAPTTQRKESPTQKDERPRVNDPALVFEKAQAVYKETGTLPTRRGLMAMVPCSEHRARVAIDRLKEIIELEKEVMNDQEREQAETKQIPLKLVQ